MTSPFAFTTAPEPVHRARLAMARLERHLAIVIGPLDPCTDLTGMALAFMSLEGLHPPYEPLPDVAPSTDPQADLDEAVGSLRTAMAQADTAVDKLRYARTIHDLQNLDTVQPTGWGPDQETWPSTP